MVKVGRRRSRRSRRQDKGQDEDDCGGWAKTIAKGELIPTKLGFQDVRLHFFIELHLLYGYYVLCWFYVNVVLLGY